MYKGSAIIVGMLIAFMVFLNGTLNAYLDGFVSGFLIHIVGILSVGLILLLRQETWRINRSLPKKLLVGGLFGVLLILFNSYCFVQIGATMTLTLGLFGQMIFSAIVDHFGLFGMKQTKMNPKKIIGFSIVSMGIVLMTVTG
ncbi:DMT family transporter [Fusibacter sp. JL216-2]|uniref:DMT family transporter n=1 Tax=Fusibacter sp. JL216-2 TaxID=3071453 RepID=UPI003D33CB99